MSKRDKRKHHSQKFCQVTGKRRYKSRAYAEEMMARTVDTFNEIGLVVYECIYCGAFHVGHDRNCTTRETGEVEA